MVDERGGTRERRARIAALIFTDGELHGNVAMALDAEGDPLFHWAWRPWEQIHDSVGGLFLC